jgi:glucuronate isomerase
MQPTTKPFLNDNFLLENKPAEILYHDYAKDQPIIDYHNHLSPQQIAENQQFKNLTKAWLDGDHYKWRAMRTLGVNEKCVTGNASDLEKFEQWAHTVPYTMRNPLYHWTHLELQRYFGISKLLDEHRAHDIYQQCNDMLAEPAFSAPGLLHKMGVQVVCSTDDPTDDLIYHQNFQNKDNNLRLFPTFRPDKAIGINAPDYTAYILKLGKVCNQNIDSYPDLLSCLQSRVAHFSSLGCRSADHGLQKVYGRNVTPEKMNTLFVKKREDKELSPEEIKEFMGGLLIDLGKIYAKEGWVMQLHLGPIRNNNLRKLRSLGPDTGFDSIGGYDQATDLSAFLGLLDQSDELPKTIIYNINPADNAIFATMIGNFNDGSIKGKVQYGSAWWFLDQKDGMEKQINTLSNMGLLSCFIGMLTDSRSFLSFPRHEYFRRILCNLIGRDIENGELPADYNWIGKLVQDICYNNVKSYFEF